MANPRLTQAIKEAYAAAPDGEIVYNTIEMRHPSFTAPIRVVNNYEDILARLEDTAPANPSTNQTFVAFPFMFTPPPQVEGSLPEATLEIDNATREIVGYLEQAITSPNKIDVTWRPYLSTQLLSGPQLDPPLHLQITEISVDLFRVSARCVFNNLINVSFPSELYKIEDFPGLL